MSGGEWADEPRALDPLNPGDAELCALWDEWRDATRMALWGQASELRQMYLNLLRRKDSMKRQDRLDIAAGRLNEQQVAEAHRRPAIACREHGLPLVRDGQHADGSACDHT